MARNACVRLNCQQPKLAALLERAAVGTVAQDGNVVPGEEGKCEVGDLHPRSLLRYPNRPRASRCWIEYFITRPIIARTEARPSPSSSAPIADPECV